MEYTELTATMAGLCFCNSDGGPMHQVPLKSIQVEAKIYDLCAEVTLHQIYANEQLKSPKINGVLQECAYIFPLPEDSAVFKFCAELDGERVEGRIAEKEVARAQYNRAVSNRRSAMLLERSDSSDNVFRCKVGNLKPGSMCTVSLTYVTYLDQEGRHNRFNLPVAIAPKYVPAPTHSQPLSWDLLTYGFQNTQKAPQNFVQIGYQCNHCLSSPIIGPRHHCAICSLDFCHGCHTLHNLPNHHLQEIRSDSKSTDQISPPALDTTKLPPSLAAAGELSVSVSITMPSPIVSITCPSHPSNVFIAQHTTSPRHASASFRSTSCSLSSDIVLLIEQERCFDPRVLCEIDTLNHTAALSLAFFPSPLDMLSTTQIHCELIFLLDCSGSMSGSSISCVRDCMQLLLRSMPVNTRFNIILFGSSWSSLFPSSKDYNDASLAEASRFVSDLRANLGGTEIYSPLQYAFTSDILPTHPRQIFLLTDGQVSNVQQLAQLAFRHSNNSRLFTFGIGGSVDRHLCKTLARSGHGKCEFVTAEDAKGAFMRQKIMRQVGRAIQPAFMDVKVDWGELSTTSSSAEKSLQNPDERKPSTNFLQCPSVAPAIFMSSRYILHALNVSLPNYVWQQAKEGKIPADFTAQIIITAANSNHPQFNKATEGNSDVNQVVYKHKLSLTGSQITKSQVIHTLAARERILELELKQLSDQFNECAKKIQDEILQLGMKHKIASSRTSFVVVYNNGTQQDTLDIEEEKSEFNFLQAAPSSGSSAHYYSLQDSTACFSPNMSFGSIFAQASTTQPPGSSYKATNIAARDKTLFGVTQSKLARKCKPAHKAFRSFEVSESNVNSNVKLFGSFEVSESNVNRNVIAGHVYHTSNNATGDKLQDVIQLQIANGSWKTTPQFISAVSRIVPSISNNIITEFLQTMERQHGVDDSVVATMLVLHLLESNFKQQEIEWQFIATKARYFVSEIAKTSEAVQQEIKINIQKQFPC